MCRKEFTIKNRFETLLNDSMAKRHYPYQKSKHSKQLVAKLVSVLLKYVRTFGTLNVQKGIYKWESFQNTFK